MKQKLIGVKENEYQSALSYYGERLRKANELLSAVTACTQDKLSEDEFVQVCLDPVGFFSKRVARDLNKTFFGFKFKSSSVFQLVEEPEALPELVRLSNKYVRNESYNRINCPNHNYEVSAEYLKDLLFKVFRLKGDQFILPKESVEEIKKQHTITLTDPDVIEAHNALERMAIDANKCLSLLGDAAQPDFADSFLLTYNRDEKKYQVRNEAVGRIKR